MLEELLENKAAELQTELNEWAKTLPIKPGQQISITIIAELLKLPLTTVSARVRTGSRRPKLKTLDKELGYDDWKSIDKAVDGSKFWKVVKFFKLRNNEPIKRKNLEEKLISHAEQINIFLRDKECYFAIRAVPHQTRKSWQDQEVRFFPLEH